MRLPTWLTPTPEQNARGAQMTAFMLEHWPVAVPLHLAIWLVATWSLDRLDGRGQFWLWFMVTGMALLATEGAWLAAYIAAPGSGKVKVGPFRISPGVWGAMAGVTGALTGGFMGTAMRSDRSLLEALANPRLQGMAGLVVVVAALIAITVGFISRSRLREAALQAQLAEEARARSELARQTSEAQLKLLQAQVEPHFLYNTLANLRYLVQTGSPDALNMTDHLIDYLRMSLPSFRAEQSTLKQEFDLARSYLAIMAIRQAGSFSYRVDLPDGLARTPLPPLMVLTLVENAVKHGLGRSVQGGHITVRAVLDAELLRIEVADTGAGLAVARSTTAPAGSGVGLANIRERLAARYGDAAALTLTSNQPQGAIATLVLPNGLL